jgi:glycerophosphoryl diester phosphodiesterase
MLNQPPARRARARRWSATIAVVGLLATVGSSGMTSAGAAAADPAAGDPPAPLVISHRGASAEAPEHTFAAYDRAVAEHTDVLECDLQLTADDVLVCMHDTTVDRTTGGTATGRVGDFTLEQLRAMDFGSWTGPEFAGAKIVPFEEQLRCYAKIDPDLQFEAETKAPAEYGGRMEPALIKLLDRLDLIPTGAADLAKAPVIIQSFELPSLQAVKLMAPSLPTAWLFVAPPAEVTAGSIPDSVDAIAPAAEYLQAVPALVQQAHGLGRQVQTWTVDDPGVMDALLADGVDGIFTNDTATLRARVDARTGAGPRRPITFARGCPGVAGTVTAASTAESARQSVPSTSVPSPGRVVPLEDAAAAGPTTASVDEGLSDWATVVLIVLLIGAIGGVGAWVVRRRRNA